MNIILQAIQKGPDARRIAFVALARSLCLLRHFNATDALERYNARDAMRFPAVRAPGQQFIERLSI